jgi:hypothetical protein
VSGIATITGNISAGNANLGNLVTANFFQGDGGLLSNIGGAGTLKTSFAFNSSSPVAVGTLPAGSVVTDATVIVVTPLDGVGATLSLGTTASPTAFLDTVDILATTNGTFTAFPATQFVAATPVILTITPGSSSAGSGVVTVNYQ